MSTHNICFYGYTITKSIFWFFPDGHCLSEDDHTEWRPVPSLCNNSDRAGFLPLYICDRIRALYGETWSCGVENRGFDWLVNPVDYNLLYAILDQFMQKYPKINWEIFTCLAWVDKDCWSFVFWKIVCVSETVNFACKSSKILMHFRMGITIFKIFIWRDLSLVIWLEITCYGSTDASP